MSFLLTILFLGGWLPISFLFFIPQNFHFIIKILLNIFIFIWIRTTFPRYRFNQLMNIGWKILLPISLSWLIFTSSILLAFDFL